MKKWRRIERIPVIVKILFEKPNSLLSMNLFTEFFQVAKSTISEDISIIKNVFQDLGFGKIQTLTGAGGGVLFIPGVSVQEKEEFLQSIAHKLTEPSRILPGGFLYLTDLVFDVQIAEMVGKIFAERFANLSSQYVVTIETKGIPLAMMTAKFLHIPLVIVRDGGRVTEGSAVSLNYVTGSSRHIRTMSLSRRALPQDSKVIIIDDFMKAGGTARGMTELLTEFRAEVLGMGVLIDTEVPEQKLVTNYTALLRLSKVDERKKEIILYPQKK